MRNETEVPSVALSPSVPWLVLGIAVLSPAVAVAAGPYVPGGAPLVSFANSILEFLTGTIGPILVGIGICIAAISLIFGSREGLSKAVWALAGGAMLFASGSIVQWLMATSQ